MKTFVVLGLFAAAVFSFMLAIFDANIEDLIAWGLAFGFTGLFVKELPN